MEVEVEQSKHLLIESAGYLAEIQQNIIDNLKNDSNIFNQSAFDDVELYDSFVSPDSLSLDRISRYFNTPQLSSKVRPSKDTIIKSSYVLEINEQMIENPRVHWGYKRIRRGTRSYCDGACYNGEWNGLGFAGKGVYKYPHGVIYDGPFNDIGEFHGIGKLIYPNGTKMNALWSNGKLVEYLFEDRTSEQPIPDRVDRRYHREVVDGFGTPGQELITNTKELPIPPGCFDVGDGVFVADKHLILDMPRYEENVGEVCIKQSRMMMYRPLYNANLSEEIKNFIQTLRCEKDARFHLSGFNKLLQDVAKGDKGAVPSSRQEKWIQRYCRRGGDEPVGYSPSLYELYTTGARNELEQISLAPRAKSYQSLLSYQYMSERRKSTYRCMRSPAMFTVYNLEKHRGSRRIMDKNIYKKNADRKKKQSLIPSHKTDVISVGGWLD
ncbi:unnamed protein product [Phyllotreta striolata]|uniref:MORN repeat-containing protein 5 n=1 Tax=Phyllotreta striolata TaxID=444603 RepID=A0A9N9XLD0_PHYSR|nr:unnamed protein product [Phyllotreta striolata]